MTEMTTTMTLVREVDLDELAGVEGGCNVIWPPVFRIPPVGPVFPRMPGCGCRPEPNHPCPG